MRIPRPWFVPLLWFLGMGSAAPAQGTVVCVGDSITQGAGLLNPDHAWPRLLEDRLGGGRSVLNLGVGGATMLSGTDRPYLGTKPWTEATATGVSHVVVVLGTNDTVAKAPRRCWEQRSHLEADLLTLHRAIRERFGSPRVLLCSPPPMFPGKAGLSDARAADLRERAPRLTELGTAYRTFAAATSGVEFVDLARVLHGGHVTDGVHLTPFGSAAIAEHIAIQCRTEFEAEGEGPGDQLRRLDAGAMSGSYHGFDRLDFTLPKTGAAGILVSPHRVAAGRPWIWRARFFGHEPALDLALLDRGFHLAYCDVANLYGSETAMSRWDEAYEFLHARLGLAPRPIFHGLSRGGLPVLEFAIAHPERTSALVLDNAVIDVRSWPGGRDGKRSDADWSRLLAARGIDEESAWAGDLSPLPRLAPLAQAGIPIHALIGLADQVVPPHQNSDPLIEAYRALGGSITPWRKLGQGHHPHGLQPVDPLVRALLRDLGIEDRNPATLATPSVEYRGRPAGWGDGGSWAQQLDRMVELATRHPDTSIVFLGDSITQGLTGADQRLTIPGGDRPIDRFEGAISLGLSGDRTEHLLHRIEHGALAVLDPEVIVLQIGVNNLNAAKHTGAEVAGGLAAVTASLLRHEPDAQIVICGPFPTGRDPMDPKRAAVDSIHREAERLGGNERVHHLDLRSLFLDDDGRPNGNMSGDAIHITRAGQGAWMEALAPVLASIQGQ